MDIHVIDEKIETWKGLQSLPRAVDIGCPQPGVLGSKAMVLQLKYYSRPGSLVPEPSVL